MAERPAIAYRHIAKAVGKRYFKETPPEWGFRVLATGMDGIATQWDLSAADLAKVQRVAGRVALQLAVEPFGPPGPPPLSAADVS